MADAQSSDWKATLYTTGDESTHNSVNALTVTLIGESETGEHITNVLQDWSGREVWISADQRPIGGKFEGTYRSLKK